MAVKENRLATTEADIPVLRNRVAMVHPGPYTGPLRDQRQGELDAAIQSVERLNAELEEMRALSESEHTNYVRTHAKVMTGPAGVRVLID
jgi:hypothetical protein